MLATAHPVEKTKPLLRRYSKNDSPMYVPPKSQINQFNQWFRLSINKDFYVPLSHQKPNQNEHKNPTQKQLHIISY